MPRNINYDVFKEPRAFIKILEIGIAIFAFSTTAGFYSEFEIQSQLKSGKPCTESSFQPIDTNMYLLLGKFEYPFDNGKVYISYLNETCTGRNLTSQIQTLKIDAKHKHEAEFFVFTGVLSFLYCLLACIYYAIFEDHSENTNATDFGFFSWVVMDFVISVLITIFWFSGSIAWAAGLPGLKDDTSPDNYISFINKVNWPFCKGDFDCGINEDPNYATIKVSIILGFLNLFVWLGNLWFLFKETPWHNPRHEGFQNESLQ